MEYMQISLNKIYKKALYTEEKLPILKVKQDNTFEIVEIKDIVVPPKLILNKTDDKYLIFDTNKDEKSLYQYIKERETLSSKEVIEIIYRIGILIENINKNNYILGSIDLEDFWMINENIDTLFIRQRKSFFKENESYIKNVIDNYICSEIASLSVKRKKTENINKASDVELYGKIFMKLAIPNRIISSYKELRYLAYNLNMFLDDFPIELHSWVNKITDMYNENYSEVKYANREIENLLSKNTQNDNKFEPKFSYSCISHPGKGKIATLSKDKLKIIDYINQDSVYIKLDKKGLFAMVADGVSNCTYGTGYKASNIVKYVCENTSLNDIDSIDKNDICDFYRKIVNKSNEIICNSAKSTLNEDELKNSNLTDIMASTFVSCFIEKNKLYFTSIGDSRILLYRNKCVIPLNIEENLGNARLKEGLSWEEYSEMERKSSITKFIGSIDNATKLPNKITINIKELILEKGDILILCSDGVTDFLNELGRRNDIWNMNENIESIINNNINSDISYINSKLVQKANYNGGWDNISSIMIKID